MSDAEVVSSVLAGNTARFEALVDRYLPMVRALCASHVYTEAVHDDLVQETFVESYLKLNTLRRPDRFGPWLAQIARRKCQSWLRREGSKQRAMDRLAHESAPPKDLLSELARSELRAWVQATVQRLPVKTREAVLLYYLEGYSVAETARCLDVREGAVKKRLQYGRELLGDAVREHLGRQPEEQSKREGQKMRVLAALPLAAAPWLKTGTAAAATGVAATTASGLGVSTVVLYTISALAVVTVAIGGWHLFVPEAPPAQSDRSDQSDASDRSDSPGPNLALAAEPSPQAGRAEAAESEDGTMGDLDVAVRYRLTQAEEVSRGTYTVHSEDGPLAVGAVVRVVPLRFNQVRFDKVMEVAGIEGSAREALALRFKARDEVGYPGGIQALSDMPDDLKAASQKLREVQDEIEQLGFKGDITDFFAPDFDRQQEEITGLDGIAHFEALPAGPCFVRAWSTRDEIREDGTLTNGIGHHTSVQSDEQNVLGVSINDNASRIRGRVGNAQTGDPVPNARVLLGTPSEVPGAGLTMPRVRQTPVDGASSVRWRATTANQDGEFSFDYFGYGEFEIKLDPTFGQDGVVGVRKPGEPVWIELKAQGGTVSGKVLTYEGQPAAGISIMREDAQGGGWTGVAVTDNDGFYSFYHDGGIMRIGIVCGTASSEKKALELQPGESATVDFTLEPAARVVLNIRDEDGKVPERLDSEGLVALRDTGSGSIGGSVAKKEVDSYVIPYLPSGHYTYTVRMKEGASGQLEFDIAEASGEYRLALQLAKSPNDLRVWVRDSNHRPVSSADVSLMRIQRRPNGSSGTYFTSRKTNSQGLCLIEGMLPGEYEVQCQNTTSELHFPKQKQLNLILDTRLESAPSLTIREGCIVPLDCTRDNTRLSARHCALYAVTPSGNVGNTLEVGTNILYFFKPGYTLGVTELQVTRQQWDAIARPGAVNEWREPIEILLGEDGGLYGSVTDALGTPVNGSLIRLLPLSVWRLVEERGEPWTYVTSEYNASGLARALAQNARTDADGAFRLRYLAPGYYVVGAQVDDAWAVSEPVEVLAGHETGPVVLEVPEER